MVIPNIVICEIVVCDGWLAVQVSACHHTCVSHCQLMTPTKYFNHQIVKKLNFSIYGKPF